MNTGFLSRARIVSGIGVLLVLTGLIANEWLLARLAPDHALPVTVRLVSWLMDILLVVLGTALILVRHNSRMQANLALTVSAFILTLIVAEVVLRFTGSSPYLEVLEANANGTGSYRLKPDVNLAAVVGERRILVQHNSQGMRWRDAPVNNLTGKRRLAFAGDSFTYGLWSDSIETSFVGVVDSLLDDDQYELLNFGTPGYGLADIELQVKEHILPFEPDYIILMFFNGNDIRDTYLGTNSRVIRGISEMDVANLRSKVPEQYIPVTYKNGVLWDAATAVKRLALYQAADNAVDAFLYKDPDSGGSLLSDFPVSSSFTSYPFWSRVPYPDVALRAKDTTLATLDRIRKLSLDNDIQLVVVAIPFEEQISINVPQGEGYDIQYPHRYIEDFAKAHDIPFLDLLPVLRDYVRASDRDVYLKSDPHLNNNGHQVVGRAVANFLRDQVLNLEGR